MPILGADALGRLALGQLGRTNINAVSASGSFALTGVSASFKISAAEAPGSYSIASVGASLSVAMPAAGTSYTLTMFGAPLSRTGDNTDQVYGGIGHYLEEVERLKSLQKITRKTPAPIVQAPAMPLAPLAPLPSATIAPQPPAIDLQTIAAQRMAAQQALAQQAAIAKRRRQAIELLLLAS